MAPFKISCMLLIVSCHLTCFGALASSGEKGKFSNEWLLQGELTTDEAIVIANEYGLEYSHEVMLHFSKQAFNESLYFYNCLKSS